MQSKYNLRGYFFGNMYLSSIQQGIQAAHVIQQMETDYFVLSNPATKFFGEWMLSDRTMILLNGGYQSNLLKIYNELKDLTCNGINFPVSMFREEEDALNGAITSVGIVLPERIWNPSPYNYGTRDPEERDNYSIYQIISSYKSAR